LIVKNKKCLREVSLNNKLHKDNLDDTQDQVFMGTMIEDKAKMPPRINNQEMMRSFNSSKQKRMMA
jgi:hypothetical protein